jgi:hypothetical protein
MKFFFCLLFVFVGRLSAVTITSTIDSIEDSPGKGQPHLIYLTNGRVVFVSREDQESLNAFYRSLERQETLAVKVDQSYGLVSAHTAPSENVPDVLGSSENLSFEPTVVSNLSSAQAIFGRMRKDYQNNSQCYNRAHVWAYEEFQKSGLKSLKLFLFFTSRYIRNYRYKWWFHVSPMVQVNENGASVSRVLDRRYTSGPRVISNWTRNFIYSGRACPIVNTYAEYRNHQWEEDCYLIPVSMYFWQPRDIERRDRTGYEKQEFFRSELNHAYWEAF